jgi:hypothetical protein
MASQSNPEGCRAIRAIAAHLLLPRFRREPGYLKAPDRIFPQILARWFRIAGTFCRQRWFTRYARSESFLCLCGLF